MGEEDGCEVAQGNRLEVEAGGGGVIRKLECGSLCVMWLLAETCQPRAHRHQPTTTTTTNPEPTARLRLWKQNMCVCACVCVCVHLRTHDIPLRPRYLIIAFSSGTRVNSLTRSASEELAEGVGVGGRPQAHVWPCRVKPYWIRRVFTALYIEKLKDRGGWWWLNGSVCSPPPASINRRHLRVVKVTSHALLLLSQCSVLCPSGVM